MKSDILGDIALICLVAEELDEKIPIVKNGRLVSQLA